jgi:hypothetical protein
MATNVSGTTEGEQNDSQLSDAVSEVSISEQDGLDVILSARDDLTETEKDIIRVGVEMSDSTYADVHRECERRGMDISYHDVWELLREEVPRDAYRKTSDDSEGSDEESQNEVDEEELEQTSEDEEVYTRSHIEHDLLKPLVFARRSATGERETILSEAEELVNIMLEKGGSESE